MDHALVPEEDEDVPGFWRGLGVPGLADVCPPPLRMALWSGGSVI
jgi:hypothetical protein